MSTNAKRIAYLLLACILLSSLAACGQVEQLLATTPRDALVINEVVTSNQLSLQDEVYGSPDWIELLNGSDQTIRLNSYYITDTIEAPQKAFRLPDVELAPGAFFIVYGTKKAGPNNLGFSLKKEGETISLLDAHMEELTSLAVPALLRDVSYARRSDGSYGYCDLPTPGAANDGSITDAPPLSSQLVKEPEKEVVTEEGQAPRSPDIWITEVVSKNRSSLTVPGCDGCTEWVELYNPNDAPVSLTWFTLTDDADELDKHNFPEIELQPSQYLIVCCGRKDCTAEGHVRIDVGLSGQGEELFLYDSNGYLLDTVSFPALSADVSWAKRSDGTWGYCLRPTPGAAARDGDILFDLSSQPMDDPFSTVHIHEVLYRNTRSVIDGDGDRSDFVELYNGSRDFVDLGGWYLSDNAENLTKWALPNISLEPGGYLLVFLSGKDREEGELHASFSVHEGETLILYNSVARRYDALRIPETEKNVSIGRNAAGEIVYFSHPTPLGENGNPLTTGK